MEIQGIAYTGAFQCWQDDRRTEVIGIRYSAEAFGHPDFGGPAACCTLPDSFGRCGSASEIGQTFQHVVGWIANESTIARQSRKHGVQSKGGITSSRTVRRREKKQKEPRCRHSPTGFYVGSRTGDPSSYLTLHPRCSIRRRRSFPRSLRRNHFVGSWRIISCSSGKDGPSRTSI